MWVSSGAYPRVEHLTHNRLTRLEMLARDKHSSSLLIFVNYSCKKLYNIGPCCRGTFSTLTLTLQMNKLECFTWVSSLLTLTVAKRAPNSTIVWRYKTFLEQFVLHFVQYARVFVTSVNFQPSLIFWGDASSLNQECGAHKSVN